jgi:hypothetical protein
VPQEKRYEGWRNCALHAENGLQSEVLYFDDNALLTMQCDAQRYFNYDREPKGKLYRLH